MSYRLKILFFFLFIHILSITAGVRADILVLDSITGSPVPYSSVKIVGTTVGTLADANGMASFREVDENALFEVSVLGYRTTRVSKDPASTLVIVTVAPDGIALKEVTVGKHREHYSKRNNPAVILMERVRENAKLQDPRLSDYYSRDKYEKISLAANDFEGPDSLSRNSFLLTYKENSEITGKPILNLSVKEKLTTEYFRADPETHKEVVKATRKEGIDEFVDQGAMTTFLEDVLRPVNIFDNDINILQNRFVSPLSHIAADFYKFYITDTIGTGLQKTVELSFVPRNSATFGFTGKLYIALGDSSYMVKRAEMGVPQHINLNFVDHLILTQQFEPSKGKGYRLKTLDDLTMELSILSGKDGLYIRRIDSLYNHNFNKEDNLVYETPQAIVTAPGADSRDIKYWEQHRPRKATYGELHIKDLLDDLRSDPVYYWGEKVLKVIVNGYIATSKECSKFDIGPVNTTYSSNEVEGSRFRVGGMTTSCLSKRWFARGYIAYGTRDHKLKYNAELEYSFTDKELHSRQFPINAIKVVHKYDIDMIGQHYMFTNPDNIFLAWKRMKNCLITYQRLTELSYTREYHSNFSFVIALRHQRQEPSAFMPFVTSSGKAHKFYDETTAKLTLRYAPGEKFFQTRSQRIPVNLDAPVFTIEQTYGPGNFLGNKFEINKTEVSIQKRFWLSAFGYIDCILKGGHLWSSVPYPSLLIPNANLSYTIQPESFALMNPMEFISDSYAWCDLTYWANGALFNYIPILKKLKLREVVGFRGYLGSLSKRNTPSIDNQLFAFPSMALATPMHGRPYMEMSAGLDNLFKILRVDYVWRMSYNGTPGVDKHGVRIAVHITF